MRPLKHEVVIDVANSRQLYDRDVTSSVYVDVGTGVATRAAFHWFPATEIIREQMKLEIDNEQFR